MSLNSQQLECLEELDIFIMSDEYYFVLRGAGGTGKTFLLKKFYNKYSKKFNTVYCLAPTHKAKLVLQNSWGKDTSTYKKNVLEFKTIDSFFSSCKYRLSSNYTNFTLRPRIEKKNENSDEDEDDDDDDYDNYLCIKKILKFQILVIIDECSMIDIKKYEKIKQYAIDNTAKIIFVGDLYQLNPIETRYIPCDNDDDNRIKYKRIINNIKPSQVFLQGYTNFTLTKIQRTKKNDLLELYNQFRNATTEENINIILNYLNKKELLFLNNESNIKLFYNKNDFINEFKKHKKNRNSTLVCCANETKNNYKLNVNGDEKYYNGQELVTGNFFQIKIPNSDRDKYTFHTSTLWELLDFKFFPDYTIIKNFSINSKDIISLKNDINYKFTFKCDLYELKTFNEIYKTTITLTKIDDKFLKEFKKNIQNLKDNIDSQLSENTNEEDYNSYMRNNNNIFESIDSFKIKWHAPLVQNNIITTYKAQGSTYNNTFVDCEDIINCRSNSSTTLMLKELYTAVSRCKDKLFLYISKDRLKLEKSNKILECKLCNINFTREYDLNKHLLTKKHNNNRENILN
jgi:hypothetical protein